MAFGDATHSNSILEDDIFYTPFLLVSPAPILASAIRWKLQPTKKILATHHIHISA